MIPVILKASASGTGTQDPAPDGRSKCVPEFTLVAQYQLSSGSLEVLFTIDNK